MWKEYMEGFAKEAAELCDVYGEYRLYRSVQWYSVQLVIVPIGWEKHIGSKIVTSN